MDDLTIAGFRAHALLPAYRRRLDATMEMLRRELDETAYVSFSAGKDSAVCAHLCHTVLPSIPMLMVDPGCPTHWLEDERAEWLSYSKAQLWNLRLFAWDKWAAVFGVQDAGAHRKLAHADMFSGLHTYADENGITTRVMGLRTEESRARATTVRHRGAVYDYVGGGRRILPIADWSWKDVWAYTVTNDLPWLSVYDHGGPQARNGLIGRSGMENGRMAFLRQHYPDAYRLARELLPEESYA